MATATSTDEAARLGAATPRARLPGKEPVSVRTANVVRNADGGSWARRVRWRPAREACWALLETHVLQGARVAIVGAGNGDDLPSSASLGARARWT